MFVYVHIRARSVNECNNTVREPMVVQRQRKNAFAVVCSFSYV